MNEIFDKLLLRIILTIFICLCIFIYKYAHLLFYPSTRQQILKNFYPTKNSADTIHLFSRIIGIGIIYSEFYFHISQGIVLALLDFFIQSVITFSIYLSSLYILEQIVLFNFNYLDEVIKRKNITYALLCFSLSISVAYIIKKTLIISGESVVIFLLIWLLSMVLLGFSTKTFPIYSKISFNKSIIQKDPSVAYSYIGFIWGWTLIISSSIQHEITDLKWYLIQVITKILLSLIFFPAFKIGLIWLFKLKFPLANHSKKEENLDLKTNLGLGIYEGILFFTSAFLTGIITGQVHFGTFYPVF